jgi:hypothetical protein
MRIKQKQAKSKALGDFFIKKASINEEIPPEKMKVVSTFPIDHFT